MRKPVDDDDLDDEISEALSDATCDGDGSPGPRALQRHLEKRGLFIVRPIPSADSDTRLLGMQIVLDAADARISALEQAARPFRSGGWGAIKAHLALAGHRDEAAQITNWQSPLDKALAEDPIMLRARTRAMKSVCDHVQRIMKIYREQEEIGRLGTPGGLEHMGDVWKLLAAWDAALIDAT